MEVELAQSRNKERINSVDRAELAALIKVMSLNEKEPGARRYEIDKKYYTALMRIISPKVYDWLNSASDLVNNTAIKKVENGILVEINKDEQIFGLTPERWGGHFL